MSSPSALKVRAFVPDITFSLGGGQLIDLFFYDQANQSFTINQDAAQVILEPTGNVGFIVNIGQHGVGKSFTLNHIMDLQPSGGLTERTRGIKVWTKPLYRDSENLYLFFVDVQGFADDQIFRDFVWFFAFFLGTIVMYSSSGPVDDYTWNDLNSFEYITTHLQLSEDAAENEYLLSYYAPKLIWLLKDLALPANDTRTANADKYVENAVYEQTQYDHSAVKTFFMNNFKDRSCLAFSPPTSPIPFSAPIHNMTSQYMENIRVVKEKIYSKATNKFFDGLALSARMMVNFITCFAELFNKRSVLNYAEVSPNQSQRRPRTGVRDQSQHRLRKLQQGA